MSNPQKRTSGAYCDGGTTSCEVCVGSCGIEEFEQKQKQRAGKRSKRKGASAELEVQGWFRDHLGVPARRALGAGRKDDVGDIHGVPRTAIQCAAWSDLDRAVREKLPALERQQANAGADFGAMFCRRRGGSYVVVMTPAMFAALWREAA